MEGSKAATFVSRHRWAQSRCTWGPIIFLAAPVFYVAAASVVQHRRRLALVTVIALFALDIGYAVYMQAYGVQHGIDSSVNRRIPVY